MEEQSQQSAVLTQGTGGGKISTANVRRGGKPQSTIDAAIDWLLENIDSDCKRWLETGADKDFGRYVSTVRDYIGYGQITSSAPNSYVNAITAPADASGFAIVVNEGAAFYRGAVYVNGKLENLTTNNGRIAGGTFAAQVFIMLHEFAHSNVVPGFESDGGIPAAGTRNNDRINDHLRQNARHGEETLTMMPTALTTLALSLGFVGSAADSAWLTCSSRLNVPRYPPIARQARLSGSATATVTLSQEAEISQIDVRGVPRVFRLAIETSLRESEFVQSCRGRKLSLRYTFRIEGQPVEWHDPSSMSFKPPNEFVIVTPPAVPMAQSEK